MSRAGKTAWRRPVDLRERMLAATVRGTNLDPNPVRPTTPTKQTLDERRERAKLAARERRAREKREREAAALLTEKEAS